MKKTEKIEIRLDIHQKERLLAIARRRGVSPSELARQALEDIWDDGEATDGKRKRPPAHRLPPKQRHHALFTHLSFNTGLLLILCLIGGFIAGRLLAG